ncbi:hypothetical protein M404DRAFT_594883 [Pisolithus tinctorius Marx 270]|uniref:Uncharacterized protein n=1 Tax=Pisolithus tinctorius Marx 270 TaxID=870435 RepID=A0A0C3PWK2_PISTI|nr:hypothetical protein M404DRAFT_594883 [Pisolithus tinctorius Marx 270]
MCYSACISSRLVAYEQSNPMAKVTYLSQRASNRLKTGSIDMLCYDSHRSPDSTPTKKKRGGSHDSHWPRLHSFYCTP